MTTISHDIPLKYEGTGPYFIDNEKLRELDTIFKKHIDKINMAIEATEREIRDENLKEYLEMKKRVWSNSDTENQSDEYWVAEFDNSSYYKRKTELCYCEITFLFPNNKQMQCASFEEVFNRPEFVKEKFLACTVSLMPYDYRCNLGIYTQSIELEARKGKGKLVEELYYELHNWITQEIEPPKWERIWRSIPFPFGIFLFILWLIFLFSNAFNSPEEPQIKRQMHEILKGGVTAQEQGKAVELLLRLNDASSFHIPTWAIISISIATIVSIILSFQPPYILLGIGRGNKEIDYWRKRIKFTFYIIPGVIFGGFILPTLQKYWEKLF